MQNNLAEFFATLLGCALFLEWSFRLHLLLAKMLLRNADDAVTVEVKNDVHVAPLLHVEFLGLSGNLWDGLDLFRTRRNLAGKPTV